MESDDITLEADSFSLVKSKILNEIYLVFGILSVPLLGISLSRIAITGWEWIYFYQIIVFMLILGTTLFRWQISYNIKIALLNFVLITIACVGLYIFGYLGHGKYFFIVAIILSGLFVGRKQAYYLIGLSSVFILIFALLYSGGYLHYDFNIDNYISRMSVWIEFIILLIAISLGLLIIINKFIDHFIHSEKQLREKQKLIEERELNYRSIFNATNEAIFIHSAENGKVVDVNEQALRMFNCNREDLIGKNIEKFSSDIPPYTGKHASEKINKAYREGVQTFEWHSRKATGELFWTEVSLRFSNIGGKEEIIAVIRDISDRKQAEKALKESEERFRLLIENIPAVTWITSEDEKTIYISPNVEKVYGFTPEEISKEGPDLWFNRIHKEDVERVRNVYRKLFTKDNDYNLEYRIQRKDGNWIWLRDRANVFHEHEGVLYAYGVFSDITANKEAEIELIQKHQELKAAEEEIRASLENQEDINSQLEEKNESLMLAFEKIEESEIKYHTLFDNANDAIFIMKENRFIEFNEKTLEIYNVKPSNIIHHTPLDFSPDFQPDGDKSETIAFEKIQNALEGKPQFFEWKHKKGTGELFDAEVSLNAIEINNEKFLQAIVRDITERKQLQQKIMQTIIQTEEKERSRFAKEIHDGLGPILSTVKLYYQWLSEATDNKKKKIITEKGINNIEEAITTIREISNNLSPHILINFGLSDAVEQFITKLSESGIMQFRFLTNTKERFNPDIEVTFYRVITELVNNTIKHAHATEVKINIENNPKKKILALYYSDNGQGFDPEKIKTRKSGLGIINMENRIKTIGGKFYLYSRPEKGIIVEISIKTGN